MVPAFLTGMKPQDMNIRWRNKPLDGLSRDELRMALVDVLDQTFARPEQATPLQSFYTTFACGMLAGGFFCFVALAIVMA